MKFIDKFISEYYELLNYKIDWKKRNVLSNLHQRSEGFKIIFSMLEDMKKSNYHILETGTLRNPGNWRDGQSSFLFQEFLNFYSGTLESVDIDPISCNNAKNFLNSDIATITCDDSHNFLKSKRWDHIDLFYLDSYDVAWENCSPSAKHHLEEFKIIESQISNNSIVAIDDNTHYQGIRSGKGRDIYEYLKSKNILPIYDEYIIIYKWNKNENNN